MLIVQHKMLIPVKPIIKMLKKFFHEIRHRLVEDIPSAKILLASTESLYERGINKEPTATTPGINNCYIFNFLNFPKKLFKNY